MSLLLITPSRSLGWRPPSSPGQRCWSWCGFSVGTLPLHLPVLLQIEILKGRRQAKLLIQLLCATTNKSLGKVTGHQDRFWIICISWFKHCFILNCVRVGRWMSVACWEFQFMLFIKGKDWDFSNPVCGCSECGWDGSSSPFKLHGQGNKKMFVGSRFYYLLGFYFP